jgi:sigma-E factor negative regulatory protein RseB
MSAPLVRTAVALLLGGLLWSPGQVRAADEGQEAYEWLMKIGRAARTLDYSGAFVYQHGTQLEAVHILHKGRGVGAPRERLVSLNGTPREVIRNEREVICLLPDMNSAVVEYRKARGKHFPLLMPERLPDLGDLYAIRLDGRGRVAGRETQIVLIMPRDEYRYGYRLWADRDTGLLLKAELIDRRGRLLEQFMFTHLAIGESIPDAAFLPPTSGESGMRWYREEAIRPSPPPEGEQREPAWFAERLPEGFRLSMFLTRRGPVHRQPIEHLVYSDGLAAVSVFIEKREGDKPFMHGTRRLGAVHAFGRELGDYHLTAVGEVPAATVVMIGSSMRRRE